MSALFGDNNVICVVGIDTDIGKTIATGLLAKDLVGKNINVITQKITQTGCKDFSEDIEKHREIANMQLGKNDIKSYSCPYIFQTPCSPHLAAELEGKSIDLDVISKSTTYLAEKYDLVLLEGVGGLYVPLNQDCALVDYIKTMGYPVILVSSSRVGSINHTLLSLHVLRDKNIPVLGVIYNRHDELDVNVAEETRRLIEKSLKKFSYEPTIEDMYSLDEHLSGRYTLNASKFIQNQ